MSAGRNSSLPPNAPGTTPAAERQATQSQATRGVYAPHPTYTRGVVSGINSGSNMGDDTLYSGTVAAATEGYLLGIPAIAVSLASREFHHYGTAARVARDMVERVMRAPFGTPVLLNVNVPDLPYEELQGTEVTRLGRRHKAQPVVAGKNPRGETVYWVGPAGAAREAGPGTDFNAVERGMVSVTPLQVDLTYADQMPSLAEWMRK